MRTETAVLFRVDAGSQHGLGHLRRCLGLAAALTRAGMTSVFLVSSDQAVVHRMAGFQVVPLGVDGASLGSAQDLERTLQVAAHYQSSTVVVDSYHVDAAYLQWLRARGLVVVAISDFARFAFPCQFVVNGAPHAPQLPYRAAADDTQFLLGTQYAMLGPEFWSVPPRRVRPTVQNVLVTLGGTDSHHLMPRLLALLDSLLGEFAVTVVVGPFVEAHAELERAALGCRRAIDLVHGPDSLHDLMLRSDLAISAGGQTLYELAVTGTPAIAVQAADNQAENIRAIAERGSARAVGRAEEGGVLSALGQAVQALLQEREARIAMSVAGQKLVDGHGAQRVALALAGAAQDRGH